MIWKESMGRKKNGNFSVLMYVFSMKYNFYVSYLLWSSHEIGFTISILQKRFRVCIENRALIWSQDYLILHSVAFLHGGWWINWVYSWSSQRLWFGVLWSRICEDVCRVWGLAIFSAFIPCNQKSTFKKPIFLTRPSHSILCEKWTLQLKKKKLQGQWSRRIVCLHVCVSRETVS